MRLNKRISGSGFCSRRKAEEYIIDGRVKVNGILVTALATIVEDSDKIAIDDVEISTILEPRLWLYYKPVGLITSHQDTHGRPTVFESLPEDLPNVISVGRLDLNSEGLLLLTNSGELARYFELPQNKLRRTYHVRAFGDMSKAKLDELRAGAEIDGFKYGPVLVKYLKGTGKNSWYEVGLLEGKNREIRKLFNYCDMQVNRLIRVGYGPYELEDLEPGQVIEVDIIK